jgi:hypothetical protein
MSNVTSIEERSAMLTKLDHQNTKQTPVPETTKKLTRKRGEYL